MESQRVRHNRARTRYSEYTAGWKADSISFASAFLFLVADCGFGFRLNLSLTLPLCADQDPLSKVLTESVFPGALPFTWFRLAEIQLSSTLGPLYCSLLDTLFLYVTSYYGERILLEAGNHDLARFKITPCWMYCTGEWACGSRTCSTFPAELDLLRIENES